VIKNAAAYDDALLEEFLRTIRRDSQRPNLGKAPIVDLFNHMLPDFAHKETGKYLDARM
jgi:hypothetical protein